MSQHSEVDTTGAVVEESGPAPFVTRRVYLHPDGSRRIWSSRHHRKSLVLPERARPWLISRLLVRSAWMPRELNWWIGTVFALGSALFAAGSTLSLAPAAAERFSLSVAAVNAIFFAGSIPFTTAAYLQLFQAANAGPESRGPNRKTRRVQFIGWQPQNVGWLSCLLQWIGTLLFNVNTFDAMMPGLSWHQEDVVVWIPDFVGSILFLLSGYMAFVEVCHAYWAWRWSQLSWWVVFVNLLGCIGFMAAAVFGVYLPGGESGLAVTLSLVFTLQGAICFFIGSVLMLPETALEEQKMDDRVALQTQ